MALADPMDHPWHSPTSTAVGEGDAGHGEAATVLDAEDLDGEGVGHVTCREMRSEAHSRAHREKWSQCSNALARCVYAQWMSQGVPCHPPSFSTAAWVVPGASHSPAHSVAHPPTTRADGPSAAAEPGDQARAAWACHACEGVRRGVQWARQRAAAAERAP